MKKRLFIFLGIGLIVSVLVAGPFMGGFVNAAEPKTLKIGVIAWLGWGLGVQFVDGSKLYADIINKKDGLEIGGEKYKIKLLVEDSKMNSATAKAAAEKLVYQDKVQFIVGDETVDAWLPVTEQNKVLVVAGTPSPAMLSPNYKYCFQATAITSQMQEICGWFAANYPDKKTLVFVAPDFRPGHLEAEKAEKIDQVYGWKILDEIFYPMEATDISAAATKIKSLNPDMLMFDVGGPVREGLNWKAAREAGYTGQFLSPNSATTNSLMSAGVAALEGYIGGVYALETERTAVAREFKAAYVAVKGKWDDPDTLFTNTFYLLVAALKKANSLNTDKVAETIAKGMEFESPNGTCKTTSRPDVGNSRAVDIVIALGIKRIEDGQNKVIHQMSIDEAYGYLKKYYGWK